MAGYNLAQYIQQFRFLTDRGVFTQASSKQVPDGAVINMLNEAIDRIHRQHPIAPTRNAQALVAEQMAYTVPANVNRPNIRSVSIIGTDGKEKPLDNILFSDFLTIVDIHDPVGSSAPGYWCENEDDQREILISPSNFATANGLIIRSAVRPTPLERVFHSNINGNSLTVGMTNGSATATVSDAAPVTSTEIQAGDELGIIKTVNTDGSTTSAAEPPYIWYGISAAPNATLTLDEVYRGLTESTANFVTSQVSEIEKAWPGGMRWAPVYFALSSFYKNSNPALSAGFRADGEQDLAVLDNPKRNLKIERRAVPGAWRQS